MHISSRVQTANSGFGWPLGRGHRSCRSCSISVPAQRSWSPSSRMSTAPWGSRGCGDIRTNDSGTVWMNCGSGRENSFKKAPPFWWDYSCCWNYSVAYDFLTLSSPHRPSSSVIRPLSLLKMTALLKMPPYGWGTLTITDVDKVECSMCRVPGLWAKSSETVMFGSPWFLDEGDFLWFSALLLTWCCNHLPRPFPMGTLQVTATPWSQGQMLNEVSCSEILCQEDCWCQNLGSPRWSLVCTQLHWHVEHFILIEW